MMSNQEEGLSLHIRRNDVWPHGVMVLSCILLSTCHNIIQIHKSVV